MTESKYPNGFPNGKHPGGRPTDYKPEYCLDIIQFFSRPLTKTLKKTYTTKAGTVIEEEIEKANELPTLEEYCGKLEIVRQTLLNWGKDHPEFLDALTRAKSLEKDFLVKNGVAGRFDKTWVFVAENFTDMRSKVEVSGPGGGPIPIEYIVPGSKSDIDIDPV